MGCHFLLQGIFPTQGSNPGLLHCRQTLHPLNHQGSPAGMCCGRKAGPPTVPGPGGCRDSGHLQRETYTHFRAQSAGLLEGGGSSLLGTGWGLGGVSVCSRIFLLLWRGLSGDVHKPGCCFSSCCWKTEGPSWLDAQGLKRCLVSRWFYFCQPAWPWQALSRRLPVVPF